MTAPTSRSHRVDESRSMLWHPRANGWMVGRAADRDTGRPRYWCGPTLEVGYSATTKLDYGTDARVWTTPEDAYRDLLLIFRDEIDVHLHGYRVVPVKDGHPNGPFRERRGTRWAA